MNSQFVPTPPATPATRPGGRYSRLIRVPTLILAGCLIDVACVGEPVGEPPPPDEVPNWFGAELCGDISPTSPPFLDEPCCAEPPFEDIDDCRAVVEPHLEASVVAATEAGLTYSAECLLATMRDDIIGRPECADATSGSLLPCEDSCQVFFGTQPEGANCEAIGHRMSDCEQGLVCGADRVCRNACELSFIALEGGFCGPQRGMWFVTCDAGLACAADGTCQAAQPIGAPCDAMTACAADGWCDDTNVCAAKLPGGSPCITDAQCSSNICKDEQCYEPESPVCARSAW